MTTEKYPDKVVAQGLNLPVLFKTKIHTQKDESIRLEITLTKEDWANLKRIQELEGGSAAEIFSKLLKARIAKKDPLKKTPVQESSLSSESTATVAPCGASSVRKYISIPKRRFVFQRDRVCQHRDEHGKICESQFRLEIDHIRPVSLGARTT